jgi:hypothetical protein
MKTLVSEIIVYGGNMYPKIISWLGALLLIFSCSYAFPKEPVRQIVTEDTIAPDNEEIVEGPFGGLMELEAPPAPGTFVFISSELDFGNKVVKGVPYSADAVTERVQTLGDGNRIVQKSNARIYRDSEGRTRREQQLGAIGPWAAAGEAHRTIFINDPVAKIHLILEPEERIARKMKLPEGGLDMELPKMPPPPNLPAPPPKNGIHEEDVFVEKAPAPGTGVREIYKYFGNSADTKKESLGTQFMEGVRVEGTRTTTTIPAKQIGNEMPIQITAEKWYSPDLQVIVLSRRNDPRFGETTYKLINVNRAEPDAALFQTPADYKVVDQKLPNHDVVFKKKFKDKN